MNFQDFVNAHLQWRENLALTKNRDDFDLENVRRDDLCAIGKWFHGPGGEQYGTLPEFIEAKSAHATFHGSVACSIEKTGHSGGDAEFEILVKALKKLSEAIHCQDGPETAGVKKTFVKLDACVKAFVLAKAHASNQSYELAQTVLKRLPCESCELGGQCEEISAILSSIQKSQEK